MGKRRDHQRDLKSQTLPSSPAHSFSSSSSSDFEFTISLSPHKASSALCPADELFYKGQLLPLHLSPRLSMVRTLILASSSSSSSDSATTASRDSTGSSNDSHSSFNTDLSSLAECDSSRPSSVAEDDDFKRIAAANNRDLNHAIKKSNKYFSLARFSSVFKKDTKTREPEPGSGSSVKRTSATAKEVIRKYLKKVKPLYEKFSQKQQQKLGGGTTPFPTLTSRGALPLPVTCTGRSVKFDGEAQVPNAKKETIPSGFSHSFSGNLRYPQRRSCVSSCPSSIRSSPSHSGVLSRSGITGTNRTPGSNYNADASSMEELQNAIQGAIAYCKNSMIQNKAMVSNEI
ncbi:probable membrane-associated kinase regulator 1 [Malania oleifera]|uniref:probable membrane-associated kinase regulator 1 n=1 Tax=Malania oleifera TaxID=397392 RepID=UPI0025AE318E|nr:probable membrane-associated kinase regulator 1 [Malania oleifera]